MSYKILGNYIREVNNRNKGLISEDLRGLSMTKEFRKSTSNIVGTDLTKYKLVNKNQFACDFMSVIRVHKLPVVLHNEDLPVIVSPAYKVFEVIDEKELDPEYLMMWFRRSEFDRYADFRCDSSIRGGFAWDELCEVELPIPSIEKQRAIVKEYNTVVNRIKLNETLNQKLEETAQALYKHWFVDFEFPFPFGSALGADQGAAQGKPKEDGILSGAAGYKSNGGKMVWCEELDKEVPEGWEVGKWDRFVRLSQGQVINAKTNHLVVEVGLPLLRITDLFHGTTNMFIDEKLVDKKNVAQKEDLIYTRTGQVGYIFRNKEGVVYNNCFKIIPLNKNVSRDFLYWHFKDPNVKNLMIELASGSAQSDLSHSAFFSVDVAVPNESIQTKFSKLVNSIENRIRIKDEEIVKLKRIKDLLLAKMTKVEVATDEILGSSV